MATVLLGVRKTFYLYRYWKQNICQWPFLSQEHVLKNDTDGANPEEFKIIKKSPHEAYNSRTFDNDIAVITFDRDVGFREGIQPICLPSATPGVIDERFAGSGTYVTGWGAKEFRGPTSNTLLQALIQVTTPEYCSEKFSQFSNGIT